MEEKCFLHAVSLRSNSYYTHLTLTFSHRTGMFVPTADQRSFWINQCCLWSAEEYRLVGVLLGLAVYNNVLLDVHLPKVMFSKLLQVEDFELGAVACIDPLLCEGLSKLLEFEPSKDVENVFCRTFEVEWEEYGATRKHELIPSGGSIPVTGDNRVDYIQRLVKWILVDSVRQQFDDLYLGFSRVINPEWTMICTGGEPVTHVRYHDSS
jgi:ubiquitin-protein ligase E3 A